MKFSENEQAWLDGAGVALFLTWMAGLLRWIIITVNQSGCKI